MRLRIILAFHMALIYYTQDFRVYEKTRDQPMPGPFPAPPIFWGKSPGDEVVSRFKFHIRCRDLTELINGILSCARVPRSVLIILGYCKCI